MKRIWLENYRCFRERQYARLAPLTLLVGENSTGKTSFLAMIRALWDAAYRHRVPNFKEEPYDLGSFDEIAHFRGPRGRRTTSFDAGFEIANKGKNRAQHWHVVFSQRETAPQPVKWRLSNEKNDLWVETDRNTSTTQLGTPRGVWEFTAHFDDDWESTAHFNDELLPLLRSWFSIGHPKRVSGANDLSEEDEQAIQQLALSAPRVPRQTLYAGAPVRSKPRRTYDPAATSRDPEGDYVPMLLAHQHFEGKEHWGRLREALERFGKEAGLFDEITVKPLGKQSGPFQLQIRRFSGRAKGPLRNVVDVGYGVSQVLPIVTELLRQDAPEMFLLQQPEVHLHPSAQAALGSLFCQIATWNRQLIVETHSDHLLDRVRMDVRDGAGSLKPEDVSILYFERQHLNVRIHSLRIDEEGNIVDAPPGYRQFFMEEVTRSLWKRRIEG